MKYHRKYHELPISTIEPTGWLRRYLQKQRDGLTGHLEEAGFPFNTKGWATPKIPNPANPGSWWPYEQTGYWIDGMIRCGHLLGDEFLICKARKSINYVLKHAEADGYLGPKFLKKAGLTFRWPHAVFFRALMAEHSATGDKRIPRALAKHYLSGTSPHHHHRAVCNVEIMLWAYEQTGDRRLLRLAVREYEKFNRVTAYVYRQDPDSSASGLDTTIKGMLSARKGFSHGVTYNEICKLGALLYAYTGNRRCLRATVNAYRKIDKFHMLIDGVHSSTERLRGRNPLDAHETCDIADYTWSVGYLLQITGQAEYADKIERACFNAAPGAVTNNFAALQYFSCPNQVLATARSNHTPFRTGNCQMSYRPNCYVKCCPGEVNRIMPNFAARMWLSDGNAGIVAALYGPSRITARLGKTRQAVTIIEETGYPFSPRIDFGIRTPKPANFTLSLRIPGWCRKARISINGQPCRGRIKPAGFVKITRTFRHNDQITLLLPMELTLSRWPGGGIGIERGPLVYALRIEEHWQIDKRDTSNKDFPAWNLYPASPWNYALDLDANDLKQKVKIVHRPFSLEPWSIDNAPLELLVPARRVRGWKAIKMKRTSGEIGSQGKTSAFVGRFELTPPLPQARTLKKRLSRKVEMVRLVPYGCTKLRLAIFPRCTTT